MSTCNMINIWPTHRLYSTNYPNILNVVADGGFGKVQLSPHPGIFSPQAFERTSASTRAS